MTIYKMRNNIFLPILYILLSLFSLGCLKESTVQLPSMDHDLSYIPYDAKFDNPNYIICDSTKIYSGRNGLQYIGGPKKLREDITSKYLSNQVYDTFSGYIVIRFLVNCEGKSGRYRAQSLNLDFSPLRAPSDLLNNSIELFKSLDYWTKPYINDSREYSKFINLKISNGKIQHVLL